MYIRFFVYMKKKLNFSARQKKYLLLAAILLVGLVLFLLIILLRPQIYTFEKAATEPASSNTPACQFTSPLNGDCVASDVSAAQTFAVMIDNSRDARPVAGINEARVVFEAVAEATITRYLALFDSAQTVTKIGPVRSARSYYVDWAGDFGSVYAHVGGSPEALTKLQKSDVVEDVNEFYNGQYFWRDRSRSAPHNTYTSIELLNKYLQDQELSPRTSSVAWEYDYSGTDVIESPVSSISVPCLPISWQYNLETKMYERFDSKILAKDDSGDKIVAKNLIFLYTDSRPIDNVGRLNTKTIGSDQALIFRGGGAIEAFWTRELTGGLLWQTSAGEKVRLTPGKIWVTVLPRACAPLLTQP